jgi:hypothetical protein
MNIIPSKLILIGSAVLAFLVMVLVTNSQTSPAANFTPAEAEKAVLARLTEIQNAAQGLDADKVFKSVMENSTGVIAQNGKVFLTRTEALDSTRQSFEALQAAGASIEYQFNQQRVTLLSPTIALAVSDGSTSVTMGVGRVLKTPFAQSVVLLLTNGDWKVFHAHRSFVEPPR